MEIVVFLIFIAVCAFALLWASRKTKEETRATHERRAERNAIRAQALNAPRDSLLSHGDQVWASRRQHANSGVENTNRFVPKSESSGVPEYDGYSRRDRHHVRERTAQVKEESHVDGEFTMTAVEFHTDTPEKEKKAAS